MIGSKLSLLTPPAFSISPSPTSRISALNSKRAVGRSLESYVLWANLSVGARDRGSPVSHNRVGMFDLNQRGTTPSLRSIRLQPGPTF